jgi:hypothetical protein
MLRGIKSFILGAVLVLFTLNLTGCAAAWFLAGAGAAATAIVATSSDKDTESIK